MTSSLVGSEMCIRDRRIRRWDRYKGGPVYPFGPRDPPAILPSTASAFCAVSYTHLTLPTICSV
eukprot:1486511-Prorocentrum_lima.AAC.1